MVFRVLPLSFRFRALEPISFGQGFAANHLRGALGNCLRLANRGTPGDFFAPSKHKSVASGFADRPRPFVFRASHLDGCNLPANTEFSFRLHLFDWRVDAVKQLRGAFSELARTGLGPDRARVEMLDAREEDMMEFKLGNESSGPMREVRVDFLTPTELKHQGVPIAEPSFAVLAARIRDRLSRLSELYGEGPLPIDFREFAARAEVVRMTHSELQHQTVARTSSRTGQTHPLGGFTGWASYEGKLNAFVPYLDAAQWVGVGRQTVWGKGQLRLT